MACVGAAFSSEILIRRVVFLSDSLSPPISRSHCPPLPGLLLLIVDTILYAVLGAYIQAVLPTSEFGVPRCVGQQGAGVCGSDLYCPSLPLRDSPWYFPLVDLYSLAHRICFCCCAPAKEESSAADPLLLKAAGEGDSATPRRRRRPVAARASFFSAPLAALGCARAAVADASAGQTDAEFDAEEAAAETRRHFQPLDSSLQAKLREGRCVSVRGLRKEFQTDKGASVRGMTG